MIHKTQLAARDFFSTSPVVPSVLGGAVSSGCAGAMRRFSVGHGPVSQWSRYGYDTRVMRCAGVGGVCGQFTNVLPGRTLQG